MEGRGRADSIVDPHGDMRAVLRCAVPCCTDGSRNSLTHSVSRSASWIEFTTRRILLVFVTRWRPMRAGEKRSCTCTTRVLKQLSSHSITTSLMKTIEEVVYWSQTQFVLSFQRGESVLRSPEPERGFKKVAMFGVWIRDRFFFIPQNCVFCQNRYTQNVF